MLPLRLGIRKTSKTADPLAGEAEENVYKLYAGREAEQKFTCKHLVKIPNQQSRSMPVLYESNGAFDFSSIIAFDANGEWIERFIGSYKLAYEPGGASVISDLIRCVKQVEEINSDPLADIMENNSWKMYTDGKLKYEALDGMLCQAHFVAFVNEAGTMAIIYYHSFGKAKDESGHSKDVCAVRGKEAIKETFPAK